VKTRPIEHPSKRWWFYMIALSEAVTNKHKKEEVSQEITTLHRNRELQLTKK
jgi:hypothetical protein